MDIKREDIEQLADPAVPFPEVDLAPTHLHTVDGDLNCVEPSISETFMSEVSRVRDEANKWQEWALLEILHWKQRCEELELENMLLQEDFERERKFNVQDIKPKLQKGVFNAH